MEPVCSQKRHALTWKHLFVYRVHLLIHHFKWKKLGQGKANIKKRLRSLGTHCSLAMVLLPLTP